jgi:hypothetical protein
MLTYEYDSAKKTVTAIAEDLLTLEQTRAYTTLVCDDPIIEPGFIQVLDLSQGSEFQVTSASSSMLAGLWTRLVDKGMKMSIVLTPSDLAYGLTRMIDSVLDREYEATGVAPITVRTWPEVDEVLDRQLSDG